LHPHGLEPRAAAAEYLSALPAGVVRRSEQLPGDRAFSQPQPRGTNTFGIGVSAFQIAGCLSLGAGGLSMLNAQDPGDTHEKSCDISRMDSGQMTSSAIVPISLPLTTGAGTMSTITVSANSATSFNHLAELLAAILVMARIIALMFVFAARLTTLLGHVVMTVLIKVMGLFTLAIGIQFIVTGCSTILEQIQFRI